MKHVSVFATLAALFFTALSPGDAGALPRYSARYNQNCNLCHVNPSGGGLRTAYASQYLVPVEMALRPYSMDRLESIQPQLSDAITFGFDIRTNYQWSDRPASQETFAEKNFFQMQGDLYLGVQMSEEISAYVDRGTSGTWEYFGMGYVLPWNGYVKVGRFLPAYGWRFDDHTQFTREALWGRPPALTDVGIEAGITPRRFELQASLTNGEPGSAGDFNDEIAYTGRGGWRFRVPGTGVAGALGGSYYRNHTKSPGLRRSFGGYGYLCAGPVIWVGEADLTRRYFRSGAPPGGSAQREVDGFLTSSELTVRVVQGLDARATFDYYDPDVDYESGTRQRYGLGFAFMPTPFTQILGMANLWQVDPLPAFPEYLETDDFFQAVFQVHFFY